MLIKGHLSCDNCGSSDALAIYDNATICFSCKKRINIGTSSLIPRRTKEVGQLMLTNNIPKEGLVWLLKSRIYAEDIKSTGIMYDLVSKRVMLPLGEDGSWQGRSLIEGDKYKYLTFGIKILPRFLTDNCDTIIITEDWCSAYRIHKAGYSAIPLLGTSVKIDELYKLTKKVSKLILWLDSDKPGREASAKIQRALQLYHTHIHTIVTVKDPKMYSDEEIQGIIAGAI